MNSMLLRPITSFCLMIWRRSFSLYSRCTHPTQTRMLVTGRTVHLRASVNDYGCV